MGRFFQILAIFLLPVVLVGGVYLAGLTIPVPHLGRDYVITLVLPKAGQPVDLPKIYGPPDNSRPLVVIDAGHGGKDPGTVSGDRYEKDVVLELALALKDRLIEEGGIRVALTTGFSPDTQAKLIAALGWHDLADLVLAPGPGVRGRPYPDLILTALLRLGADSVHAVAALGDTANDVESALRAGCSIAAGTLTGAHDERQLVAAGATHVVSSVTDFADLLLKG